MVIRLNWSSSGLRSWQKNRQHAEQRQERTEKVHVLDAVDVCQMPKRCRTNPAKAEHQPEEQTGNHADVSWHQFLRVYDDC